MQITSLDKYKAYAGISGTGDDDALEEIIPAVSELIERRAGRSFTETTYRKWFDGNGRTQLRLPEWPITRIFSVAIGTVGGATVKFTGGQRASVTCDGTNIKLWDLTAGVATDTTIILASYVTLTLLVAEINTNSGWTATVVSGQGDEASTAIRPFDTKGCLDRTVDLELPDDGSEVRVVSETNRMIEGVNGLVSFPKSPSSVFVWYTAGYDLPADGGGVDDGNVPDGLSLVVNQIVQEVLGVSKASPELESEKIGNYQYKLRASSVDAAVSKRTADLSLYYNRAL